MKPPICPLLSAAPWAESEVPCKGSGCAMWRPHYFRGWCGLAGETDDLIEDPTHPLQVHYDMGPIDLGPIDDEEPA